MTDSGAQSPSQPRPISAPDSRLRVPWPLLLAGLVGVVLYLALGTQSRPSPAAGIKLSRADAEARSVRFLRSIGAEVGGLRRTTVFWSSPDDINYLEKTLGTARTNHLLARTDLPVAGWKTRFFSPLKPEEFSVLWSPRGELIGFAHHLADDQPMPDLHAAEARRRAEHALARWFPGLQGRLAFSAGTEIRQPHRIDRSFEWQVEGAPAQLRRLMTVEFSGSQLTKLLPSTVIPETFARHESAIASERDLLQSVADMAHYVLLYGVLIFAIVAWRRRWMRWAPAIAIASLVLVVEVLDTLNQLPLAWFDYATQTAVPAFWLSQLQPLLSLPGEAFLGAVLYVAADTVGRLAPRSSYSLGDLTSASLHATPTFRTSTLAGVGAAGVQLGYVSLFYVLGRTFFGVYAPIDVPGADQLSTSIPWIQPLLVGLSAAFYEEALFRLFAVTLLLRWLKRPWLAVLLPAILWGFLHTGYHVEPIFVHGLELTVVGVFLGLVFLRFGIWATIVSHCIYNATITSSPFLSSGSPYLIVASIAVIAAITLPALLGRSRRPFVFPRLDGSARSAVTIQDVEPDRRVTRPSPALNIRVPIWICVVALVIAALVPIRWRMPSKTLDARQAVSTARQQLQQLGYDFDGYKTSVSLTNATAPPDDENYLRGRMPRREWLRYLDRYAPERTEWTVNFVAPGKVPASGVRLDSQGRLVGFGCSEADSAALPTLSAAASRAKAERFLAARGIAVKRLEYVGIEKRSHPRRTDAQHVWLDTAASVGEQRRKIKVFVAGDRIAGFSQGFALPESYWRAESQTTVWKEVQAGLETIFSLLIALLLIRSLFSQDGLRPWFSRGALAVGVGWGIVRLVGAANAWPSIWESYDSSGAVSVFMARSAMETAGQFLTALVGGYAVTLMFLRFAPRAFPEAPTSTELRDWARTPPWRWYGNRAGFTWALAVLLMGIAIQRGLAYFAHGRSVDALHTELDAFCRVWPPFALVEHATTKLAAFVALGAIVCALRRTVPLWLLGITVGVYILSTVTVDPAAPWQAIDTGITLGLLWLIAFYVVRFRLPFYFWFVLMSASMPFVPWLLVPGPHRIQAMIALAPLAVLVRMSFAGFRRGRQKAIAAADPVERAA